MAIANYDGIISARSAGGDDDIFWTKTTSRTPGAAGQWYALAPSAGYPAAASFNATKTSGALVDSTNAGALPIKASTSQDAYLLTEGVTVSSVSGFSAIMFADVVWACTADTSSAWGSVSSFPSLTRYTDGKGLQIAGWATVATAATLSPTVTYTAPEGSGHTTTLTTPSTTVVAQCVPNTSYAPFSPLASGDTGVTAITNVAFNATATGNFTLAIIKPLAVVPTVAANSYVERDSTTQIDSLIKLPRGSDNKFPAIMMFGFAGGTSACATQGGFVRKVNSA